MIKQEFTGYTPNCLQDVQRRLADIGASPKEEIGQHFLVNADAINLLAQSVSLDSRVIEVGCGVGNLTEKLAQKASDLYGIEIDQRYRPLLDALTNRNPNLHIIYGDALAVDYKSLLRGNWNGDTQIVASLPYHITEPFIQKVAPLRLSSVTLVVGKRYAESIGASINSPGFGRLSILTATFFDVDTLATIQKNGFFPIPRTDSAIVQLSPRDKEEVGANRRDVIFRHLFLTLRQNSTLRRGLKEGLDAFEQSRDGLGLSKRERNHKSRSGTKLRLREAVNAINRGEINFAESDQQNPITTISGISRNFIARLNIDSSTLDKPFSLLNNSELRMLYSTLE